MGDKLIVMVAIADEPTATRFRSTEHNFRLMDEFDMTMVSSQVDLSDYDAAGVDFDNLVKNAMRNHVGRRRRRNEMDEKYGKERQ